MRMKPKVDGLGAEIEGFGYDGPPPVPGTYHGFVKKMGLAKIATGENKGADRIALVIEIDEGKFKGAGIVHSLNMTDQGKGWVNNFLDSLTDGSERQRNGLQKLFWQKGYDVANEADGKLGHQFLDIGGKFKPIGKTCMFVTVLRPDQYGEDKAAIARFIVPRDANEDDDEDDSEDDPMQGLGEFSQAETMNPDQQDYEDNLVSDISDDDDIFSV